MSRRAALDLQPNDRLTLPFYPKANEAMRRPITLGLTLMAATLATAMAATALLAAIPNRTPEQLQERSDVIVVGTVHEIHAQRTTDELWDNQKGTVLFHVETVEKAKEGQKIEAGDQLRIGFWTMRWVGPREDVPPYGSGHYLPKPDPNAKVRAYLGIKEDGSYEAILPNGLVPLDAEKPAK